MDIIIIGAGPSGMMCAINAKNKNNNVTIIDRNDKVGKKLLLTGSGRCNYFNENFSEKYYYSDDENLIKEIINEDNKDKTLKVIYENVGIYPINVNGYYYPYSFSASSFCNLLYKKCLSLGVKFILNEKVEKIKKDNKFIVNDKYTCDKLVIACGGKSFPKTGSDESIYNIISLLGHHVTNLYPHLVQLKTNSIKELSGVKNHAKVSLYENDKLIKTEEGELQFVDYGLSGICIFQLSGIVAKGLDTHKSEKIKIDFLPFVNDYDSFVNNRANMLKDLSIINMFESIINYKILKYILKELKISEEKRYIDLSQNEKSILKKYLTSFEMNVYDVNGFDKAQVTMGGVLLKEINTNTMMSKLIDGLYFTGEVIDLTGDCGGYNLFMCFITGFLAGSDINDKS